LFSFAYPNELKNKVVRNKKLLIFFKFIFKRGQNFKFKDLYNFKNFNYLNNHFSLRSGLGKLSDTYGNAVLNSNITDLNFKAEVKLKRVKFKPGYARIWRRARLALKESLGLKFIYQKQLTKFLTKYVGKSSYFFFLQNELVATKVIINSHIILDYNTFLLFFNSKLFYVNGVVLMDKNLILLPMDFIQTIVSKWYYIFFR
jgi:hypothetical protein